jgi:hypothetical protein
MMAAIPVVVLVPTMVMMLVEWSWIVLSVVLVVLSVLLWGVFGMKIRVQVEGGSVTFTAPFYRRAVPVESIDSVELIRDNGLNPGLVNWPVVGRTESRGGVRLNLGGSAALEVAAGQGTQRITTVFEDMATAKACARDIEDARASVEGIR